MFQNLVLCYTSEHNFMSMYQIRSLNKKNKYYHRIELRLNEGFFIELMYGKFT